MVACSVTDLPCAETRLHTKSDTNSERNLAK
jgi:hypothetical protein